MIRFLADHRKWRLTYEGGQRFIEEYLIRFSTREAVEDFEARKSMSYCPAFAKIALTDIRNAIFSRLFEIDRKADAAYMQATQGLNGGVDGRGTSMQQFLGANVLDELLPMGSVAVWVDNTISVSNPYLYIFKIEEILGVDSEDNPTKILLKDTLPTHDDLGMLGKSKTVFRLAELTEKGVLVSFLDTNKKHLNDPAPALLKLDKLPVIVLKIKESLLKDVADYQIAHTNLASSDMNYTLRANFPFYTEQYDVAADMMAKQVALSTAEDTDVAQKDLADRGIDVGVTTGRRYPKGLDRPGFISPPTEPLEASMDKQKQLKEEIRLLVNLALSNMSPTRSSSESKQHDQQGLEAGLAYIGQELERAERYIADIWHQYLGSDTIIYISYPNSYDLKTDEQRQIEASKDLDMVSKTPSLVAQKELTKRAMLKLFGTSLDHSKMEQINDQIDSAQVLAIDPIILHKDLEAHLVSNEFASGLRGYPEGESVQAGLDHADKLSRIAVSQAEASIIAGGGKDVDIPKPNTPGINTPLTESEKRAQDREDRRNES